MPTYLECGGGRLSTPLHWTALNKQQKTHHHGLELVLLEVILSRSPVGLEWTTSP